MVRKYWWIVVAMLPIGMLVGFLAAAGLTYVQPKTYQSQAIIEVRPPAMAAGAHDRFLATEIMKIKGRDILGGVVNELQLTQRWNLDKNAAIGVLERAVNVEGIRGTDLIAIRAIHTNKVDARDIAESVANHYKQMRDGEETALSGRRLDELNKAVREQEDVVEERRKVLSIIMQKKGIPLVEKAIESGENTEQAIRQAMDVQDYVDAKRDFETAQALLNEMKIKQVGETISAKIPNDRVTIHEAPEVSEIPFAPNVAHNLRGGVAAGMLFSIPCSLMLMWLLHRGSTKRNPFVETDKGHPYGSRTR